MYFSVFVILVLLFADYWYRRTVNKTAILPRPSYYVPFIGHAKTLLIRTIEGFLRLLDTNCPRYGHSFATWIFHEFLLVTQDPKVLDAILNSPKHIRKPRFYDPLRPWLGDCLVLSSGIKWKTRRKKFTSVFHFSAYEDFLRVFDEQSSILVERLQARCGKGAFDVNPYIVDLALDIIAEIGMGFKMNAQTTTSSEYAHALHGMIGLATKRMSQPILSFDMIFRFFTPYLKKKQDEYVRVLHSFAEKNILEARKSLLKKNSTGKNPISNVEGKLQRNIIDILLQTTENGEPFSDRDIREEIDALMLGGHDTSTIGTVFTMYCLARHPDVQNKVLQELRDVIGDDLSMPVGLEELNKLKYLELVLKETLRLYPPATIIARKIEEDIQAGDYKIPAKTTAIIPIKLIQLNPQVFPEPEKFIPERFAKEAQLEKQFPYSFLAFSAGPRDCPGRMFAMLELKSIVSKILRHFEVLPSDVEPVIRWNVLMSLANGMHIALKPRVYT